MTNSPYVIERFLPQLVDSSKAPAASDAAGTEAQKPAQIPSPQTRAWVDACWHTFGFKKMTDEAAGKMVTQMIDDGFVFTQARASQPVAAEGIQALPVATFAYFPGSVNVGGAELLPAGLISDVTVRPTHKRQGLLRAMMQPNLEEIAAKGMPMALLTAAGGGIYGRFGFEPIAWDRQITVDSTGPFRLRDGVALTGQVEIVDPAWLRPRQAELFDRFHRDTLGSVMRGKHDSEERLLDEKQEKISPEVKTAVYFDEAGLVAGYVVYTYHEPFGDAGEIVVVDLIGTREAELALWNFLASIELVKKIRCDSFPADPDATDLVRSLADQRVVVTAKVYDSLWARVLAPIAVFEARGYTLSARRAGLELVFSVDDPANFASGTYRVKLGPAGATVTSTDEAAQVAFNVNALAPLAFGTASLEALLLAGLASGATAETIELADSLFAPVGSPRFESPF